MVRDPWAWAAVAAILPLLLRAWGAPLGQPFADDFHFIHHAIFREPGGWLDGGGALIYWRPLSRQAYFGLLSPALLSAPWVVALLHAAVLGLASLLLYRAWRAGLPGPWAAAAASFPWLAESSRTLLLWPSAFQDLGALAFSALALHEASRRRLPTALAALAAALLCKEIAVVTAVLLPWVPWEGERRERRRWALATGTVVLVWGACYALVMQKAGLMFQRHLEAAPPPLPHRLVWSLAHGFGDAFSLGALSGSTALAVEIAAAGLIGITIAVASIDARARARIVRAAPWMVWGFAWFLANAATLTEVYPVWGPFRSAFGMVGLGATLAALAWAAGPAWLSILVAVRLAAVLATPGPPAGIAPAPPRSTSSLDFRSLVRLSRLAVETRSALLAGHPSLPPHAVAIWHQRALLADAALAGNKALQVWYRDSTLTMAWWDDVTGGRVPEISAVLEYEPRGAHQVVGVATPAMTTYLEAMRQMEAGDCAAALVSLARAESLQTERAARVFFGRIAGKRALCFLDDDRLGDARREAERGLTLWPEGSDPRYVLAVLLAVHGQAAAARAQLDTLLARYPFDSTARQLLDTLKARGP